MRISVPVETVDLVMTSKAYPTRKTVMEIGEEDFATDRSI